MNAFEQMQKANLFTASVQVVAVLFPLSHKTAGNLFDSSTQAGIGAAH